MPNRRQHLRISRKFLGLKGNPAVHLLLDGAGLPIKLKPQYHRLTHNPNYVRQVIKLLLGEKGELEAWSHLLTDWGFIEIYKKQEKCPMCGKVFNSKKGMKIHMKRMHKENEEKVLIPQ